MFCLIWRSISLFKEEGQEQSTAQAFVTLIFELIEQLRKKSEGTLKPLFILKRISRSKCGVIYLGINITEEIPNSNFKTEFVSTARSDPSQSVTQTQVTALTGRCCSQFE
jgi:hypothetical protein